MKLEEISTYFAKVFVIKDAPALDPIIVVFIDEGPSSGRMIVECYGKSWTAWWGGTGCKTVREFVASCNVDYLVEKLWHQGEKRTKVTHDYISRICAAICEAVNA